MVLVNAVRISRIKSGLGTLYCIQRVGQSHLKGCATESPLLRTHPDQRLIDAFTLPVSNLRPRFDLCTRTGSREQMICCGRDLSVSYQDLFR